MYPGTHAQTRPDRSAIVMAVSGRVVTYRELDENSARLAAALHDLGLRRGDTIALLSDNAAEAFEVYWAAIRSGLYFTAVNWHLSPDEAAYILQDSDAQVLIVSAGVRELAEQVANTSSNLKHHYAFGGEVTGYEPYAELLALPRRRLATQPRGAEMLYSSGTTGRPKGVRQSLPATQVDDPGDSFLALIEHVFGLNDQTVYLSPAPIYHAAPLRWCAGIHGLGGTVVLLDRFDAERALEAIDRYHVTAAQLVPTMFIRMLQLPADVRQRFDLSSLKLAIHAGAPCPPDVKDAMIQWWGPILVEYYAATEGHGITLITSAEWQAKRGSVGRSALGPLHICDDDGNELAAGDIGTVYFEQADAAFEYHNDPEKTASSRHPEHSNWVTVGDIGYVDVDGFLYLTDRKAFMIISGGVNIYPQEVENVLALHPKIFDVAVIGIPDPEMGERVKAVVQLRDGVVGSPALAAELIEYVRDRIAHYKAPQSIDFVDDLPRLPTGKLAKRVLLDRYLKTGA
ncbi:MULTISPECIES: acyl-CoA synthetase [unclassified Mycobacterium]|uniref:acyl-CoA synthetase n=1 Tax=unclassified Mycobacterium TaxID=2642494 RepID=UPI0029C7B870|nr:MULTISPECIES: acyl-CoA synthetase [unclassified Mycobacterium]